MSNKNENLKEQTIPLSIKKEHPASGNGKCKGPGARMCPEGQWSSKEAMWLVGRKKYWGRVSDAGKQIT